MEKVVHGIKRNIGQDGSSVELIYLDIRSNDVYAYLVRGIASGYYIKDDTSGVYSSKNIICNTGDLNLAYNTKKYIPYIYNPIQGYVTLKNANIVVILYKEYKFCTSIDKLDHFIEWLCKYGDEELFNRTYIPKLSIYDNR